MTVNITHDFLGDLEIYLIAPNNHLVLLQNRTLGRRRDRPMLTYACLLVIASHKHLLST